MNGDLIATLIDNDRLGVYEAHRRELIATGLPARVRLWLGASDSKSQAATAEALVADTLRTSLDSTFDTFRPMLEEGRRRAVYTAAISIADDEDFVPLFYLCCEFTMTTRAYRARATLRGSQPDGRLVSSMLQADAHDLRCTTSPSFARLRVFQC